MGFDTRKATLREPEPRMRFTCLLLLALLPFSAFAASSAIPVPVDIEDMTWPEIKARMDSGTDTIIIPSGGTEQNGPLIATGKHNWIVRFTCGEIARRLGNALVAPVITYVPEGAFAKEGHMLFPGTISLREETFAALLEDTARSFRLHGFKRIYFIGDHGGNQTPQQQVADKLGREWKDEGIIVLHVGDYYTDAGAVAWMKEQNLGGTDPAGHAGFMDASEIMASHADAIRRDEIKAYKAEDFNSTGVLGDPSRASAEYGRKLLEFKIQAALDQIARDAPRPK